ncbi:MAG: (2Fe-2S)-binding protein [Flavobacteriaceae bacterium]
MAELELTINNRNSTIDVEGNKPLLWFLRDELGLTGTKYGCGLAQCGACTVHLDGMAVRSCSLPVSSIGEREVTTIEGLAQDVDHPILKAWKEMNVPQCGYCQTRQIMNAMAFLRENKHPTDEEIDLAINGYICRCGSYYGIKKVIKNAKKN